MSWTFILTIGTALAGAVGLVGQQFMPAAYPIEFAFGLILASSILTAVLTGIALRTYRAQVGRPVQRMEDITVAMLAGGAERASVTSGSTELRAIARALNFLADEQARAKDVESRMQLEFGAADSAKNIFLSNVSHELRTPLTSISGYVELLEEELKYEYGDLGPQYDRMFGSAKQNVTRLLTLIDDLLTLAREEERVVKTLPIDLGEFVREVVSDVKLLASRKNVALSYSVDESSTIMADGPGLHRAILNVLTNAVKFSPEGSQVEIHVRRRGTEAELVVRDYGMGIPASEIDKLGTRFFRGSNARANEIAGTGLGLRIVQATVENHGGQLAIQSREGEGTTVTLRLPAV